MKWLKVKSIHLMGIITLTLIILILTLLNVGRKNYEILSIEQAPAIVYEKYESQKELTGYSVIPYDGTKYVLITMGRVPTTGYEITIKSVKKSKENWIIYTEFLSPDPDEIVAMVISYPTTVVKLPPKARNISVFKDNQKLPQIN